MGIRDLAAEVRRTATSYRSTVRFPALPSPEILFTAFVFLTAFALSPVGQRIDSVLDLEPVTASENGSVYWFLSEVLDRLSSQRIAGLLLLVTSVVLSWLAKSVAPVVIAGLAEVTFLATGVLKVVIAKDSTTVGDPNYWSDGILLHGKHSMAYPSGHAMESVALYGAILLLLVMYAPGWTRRHTHVGVRVWQVLIVQTSTVSWLLGRHWVSDLVGGVIWGTLSLVLVVGLVHRGIPQALAQYLDAAVQNARKVAREHQGTRIQARRLSSATSEHPAGHPLGPLR